MTRFKSVTHCVFINLGGALVLSAQKQRRFKFKKQFELNSGVQPMFSMSSILSMFLVWQVFSEFLMCLTFLMSFYF